MRLIRVAACSLAQWALDGTAHQSISLNYANVAQYVNDTSEELPVHTFCLEISTDPVPFVSVGKQSGENQGKHQNCQVTRMLSSDRTRSSSQSAQRFQQFSNSWTELEVPGYACHDHFLEHDTILQSWHMLSEILLDRSLDDILIDVGMPVLHRGNRYNARIIILSGQILLVRPKLSLANEGVRPLPSSFPMH
jgi:hypothetical protein